MIVLLIARSVKSWLVTLLIIIILCITQSLLAVCQGYTISRGLGFTRLHEACLAAILFIFASFMLTFLSQPQLNHNSTQPQLNST